MALYKIIETDNFGGDYPDEKFVNVPAMEQGKADLVAQAINIAFPSDFPRYWRAVPEGYTLQPGFTP